MDNCQCGNFELVQDGSNQPYLLTYLSTNLTTGYLYRFKYVAVNEVGKSVFSSESDIYACAAPTLFASPLIMQVSSTWIMISWLDPQDNGGCPISGFEIWRDDSLGGNLVLVHPEMNNLPEINVFNITDLPSSSLGNTLRIQLKAKNSAGYYISS